MAAEQATASRPFAGRRAIVTGGRSGIGAATTALLRSRGAQVAVLDREPGPDAAVDACAADLLGGPADVLVPSAGIYRIAPFLDLEPGEWDDTPMLQLMDDPGAGRRYLRESVPLRRLGTAAEVAAAIAFLASGEAG